MVILPGVLYPGYISREAQIHWNGPVLAKADKLEEAALISIFGRGRWNFTTMANKADSKVTKQLREVDPSVPFYS